MLIPPLIAIFQFIEKFNKFCVYVSLFISMNY